MARSLLNKRLLAAESKIKAQQHIRDVAESRNVSHERLEEIMEGLDSSWRGGEEANQAYIKTLTTGELLRVYRERDVWVRRLAQKITQEHMDKLAEDGIGPDRMTESELQYIIDHGAGDDDDGIEWDDLPLDVLNKIEIDPTSVDFEELKHQYPKKYSPIAGLHPKENNENGKDRNQSN